MPGRLFVIPNTLGGVAPAAVLPERTLEAARRLSHFVAETPKLARVFLKSIDSPRSLQSIAISELSEHTRPEDVARLLQPALDGHDVGLVSDAGCPGIADPGALLVAAAHDAAVIVVPLPGPSAILLALMASGMDGQRFVFHGYLPAKTDARAAAIRALDAAAARDGATQIFIETPYRNDAMLSALLKHASGRSRLCVAADLTTATELVRSESVEQWRQRAPLDLARRPAVFLLGRGASAIPRRRS